MREGWVDAGLGNIRLALLICKKCCATVPIYRTGFWKIKENELALIHHEAWHKKLGDGF